VAHRAWLGVRFDHLFFVWRAVAQSRLVNVQVEFSKHAIQKKIGERIKACSLRRATFDHVHRTEVKRKISSLSMLYSPNKIQHFCVSQKKVDELRFIYSPQ